ncbi:MAG: hypothetical protein JRH20_03295 [Deltaproteobacteria bacterium]|nr:hypothetical protein [Deltaproteobacteria bacterium]
MRDASSLVLAREGAEGPQLYMVQRHRGHVFMAQAQVFVGGRVDAMDRTTDILSRCTGGTPEQLAQRLGVEDPLRALGHYVGALREAFEESALLLVEGVKGMAPDAHERRVLRDALLAGERSFVSILVELEATLPLDSLRYLDHWITPPFEPRQYDTRFFIAAAPATQSAHADLGETEGGDWFGVEEVLARHLADEVILAPPTLCILEGLRGARSVEEILAQAKDSPVTAIRPRLLEGVEPRTLALPADHRYADPLSSEGRVHAMVYEAGRWVQKKQLTRRVDLPSASPLG